jgi:DNA-directed RNA polymerase specialized sigma24 family protein
MKSKPRRQRSKEEEKFYISPAEFRDELKKFYESGSEDVPDILSQNIMNIAKGLSYTRQFKGYSYIEDMIGDAILKMFLAVKHKKYSFDTGSVSNPFSYFTTIAWHAFINRIKKEKKMKETHEAYKEKTYGELLTCDADSVGHIYVRPTEYDDEFIDDGD